MTEDLTLRYIEWLHYSYAYGQSFALLWDVYATHRTPLIKQYAQAHNIPLLFIPAGQTGEYQPLDFRIFGSLKARAKSEFDHNNVITQEGNEQVINLPFAVELVLKCWEKISPKEIINAWSALDKDLPTNIDPEFINSVETDEIEEEEEMMENEEE